MWIHQYLYKKDKKVIFGGGGGEQGLCINKLLLKKYLCYQSSHNN